MPQINFAGSVTVVEEDFYEYDTPPNLKVRLDIDNRSFLLTMRENRKKPFDDHWYNDCSVVEIIEGHV